MALDHYLIGFTPAELEKLGELLIAHPYRDVAGMLATITSQRQQQDRAHEVENEEREAELQRLRDDAAARADKPGEQLVGMAPLPPDGRLGGPQMGARWREAPLLDQQANEKWTNQELQNGSNG